VLVSDSTPFFFERIKVPLFKRSLVFIGTGGFGRRASDGGAYIQMYCIEDGDESEEHATRNPHSVRDIDYALIVDYYLALIPILPIYFQAEASPCSHNPNHLSVDRSPRATDLNYSGTEEICVVGDASLSNHPCNRYILYFWFGIINWKREEGCAL
jgi:hypothetical protein